MCINNYIYEFLYSLLYQILPIISFRIVSLGHTLHHLGLDGTVTVVLSIEVLGFVAHSVSCVADDGDLNFGVVWKLLFFTSLSGMHRDLHAS